MEPCDGIMVECENEKCYMGCIALVDEDGNVEYKHRDTVRQHIATVMLEETKFPHELIELCIDLSCGFGRWNPCRVKDAYGKLMQEGLDKCDAVKTQLKILMPDHTPAVESEVTLAVLQAIFNTVEDDKSWFDKMLDQYFDTLDRNFACKASALEAAEVVWNTRCDFAGECVAGMAWKYINKMQRHATEQQRVADATQRVDNHLCSKCGKNGSPECSRSWCGNGYVWVATMSDHTAVKGPGSVGYFQPWRVRWDKDKVEFVLL